MATISTDGIAAGSTISATHITNIISALSGTSAATVVATGSFSGSLTGIASTATAATLAAKASTLASNGGNGTAMTFDSTGQYGQPIYLWGGNNGTAFNLYNPIYFTLPTASHALTALTTTNASIVPYSGITGLPAGISVNGGVAAVEKNIFIATGVGTLIVSASEINSGYFYTTTANLNPIIICLDSAGSSVGEEFTFFGVDLTYSITFTTDATSKIISENGYLSMYGTGSAVTAKLIDTGPSTWALIGSLKA